MRKVIKSLLIACLLYAATASAAAGKPGTNPVEIESVSVNGQPAHAPREVGAALGSFPQNSSFDFHVSIDPTNGPLRVRYQLEGYENSWHEGEGDMALSARFFNEAGDQIHQNIFKVSGQSA